jgi:hypothetical protein
MPANTMKNVVQYLIERDRRRHQAHPSTKTHAHIADAARVNAIRKYVEGSRG